MLVALVMTGTPRVMVNVTVLLPVSAVALVAVNVTLYTLAVVGVPEITPVLVTKDSPAGRAVELKLAGSLLAAMV